MVREPTFQFTRTWFCIRQGKFVLGDFGWEGDAVRIMERHFDMYVGVLKSEIACLLYACMYLCDNGSKAPTEDAKHLGLVWLLERQIFNFSHDDDIILLCNLSSDMKGKIMVNFHAILSMGSSINQKNV